MPQIKETRKAQVGDIIRITRLECYQKACIGRELEVASMYENNVVRCKVDVPKWCRGKLWIRANTCYFQENEYELLDDCSSSFDIDL